MTDRADSAASAPGSSADAQIASLKRESVALDATDGYHSSSFASPSHKMSNKRPRSTQHIETVKAETAPLSGAQKSSNIDPLPHGTFTGRTFHRNSLNPLETLELGHVTLHHLIPHPTTHCFATTFKAANASWLEHIFGKRVDRFLLVKNDKRDVKHGQVKVGRGVLEPIAIERDEIPSRKYQRMTAQSVTMSLAKAESAVGKGVKMEQNGDGNIPEVNIDPSNTFAMKNDMDSDSSDDEVEVLGTKRTIPNWHRIAARPATGGSLHSKILLFRTARGLRVVVTGSNLCPQWRADRDCLWVQDFDVRRSAAFRSPPHFERHMRSFVHDVSKCQSSKDDTYVQDFNSQLFDGIDFSTANAELVYSFPRSKNEDDFDKLAGGYPMLSKCVERLRSKDEYAQPDTDDEDECYSDPKDSSDKYSGLNVIYATAGSFGNVSPVFLRQMYHVMSSGNVPHVNSKEPAWEEVPSAMKCLWPSTVTAQSMLPSGVINSLRNIPMRYWETIPPEARRRIFHDASPNTPSSGFGIFERQCHPVVHGKIIYATPRIANDRGLPSIVYVGSHNFSRAAWGEGIKGPRNIELGVVLATNERATKMEWEQRFPCTVIPHNAIRPPNDPYLPASAHKGIRSEWDTGDPKRAEERLREYLQREFVGNDEEMDGLVHACDNSAGTEEGRGSKESSTSPRDVVDLCGDSEEQTTDKRAVIDLYDDKDSD